MKALLLLSVVLTAGLCGCGSPTPPKSNLSAASPPKIRVGFITEPGCLDHAVARVVLPEHPPGCSVHLVMNEPGLDMPCDAVGDYLRRELNPSDGAIVGIVTQGGRSDESLTSLAASLVAHGFENGGSECFVSRTSHVVEPRAAGLR